MLLGVLKEFFKVKPPATVFPAHILAATKLNMGCGHHKAPGYINVDASPVCQPDLVFDLETTPWPWHTSSIEEVAFIHSLEHMGQDAKVFFNIMTELYRICKHGAKITIKVPHPRHDAFTGDPTHVRAVTPTLLSLFDKDLNDEWKRSDVPNTPFAHYLGVNFKTIYVNCFPDAYYLKQYEEKQITLEELEKMGRELNNVFAEYQFILEVIKPM